MNIPFHSFDAKSFKKLPHYNFFLVQTKFAVVSSMEKVSHLLRAAIENLKLTQFTSHVIPRQTVALHDRFHHRERMEWQKGGGADEERFYWQSIFLTI